MKLSALALAVVAIMGGARGAFAKPEPEPEATRALGQELYDRAAISIVDGFAYQGQPARPLEGADFYRAVGRPDLADEYRDRQQLKTVMRFVGGAAIGVGIIWGLLDVTVAATARAAFLLPCTLSELSERNSDSMPSHSGFCNTPDPSPVPWAVAGAGLGVARRGAEGARLRHARGRRPAAQRPLLSATIIARPRPPGCAARAGDAAPSDRGAT